MGLKREEDRHDHPWSDPYTEVVLDRSVSIEVYICMYLL